MKMNEQNTVPNFLTTDYRGMKRVCRRCKKESHFKASRRTHGTVDCSARRSYSAVAGLPAEDFPVLPGTSKETAKADLAGTASRQLPQEVRWSLAVDDLFASDSEDLVVDERTAEAEEESMKLAEKAQEPGDGKRTPELTGQPCRRLKRAAPKRALAPDKLAAMGSFEDYREGARVGAASKKDMQSAVRGGVQHVVGVFWTRYGGGGCRWGDGAQLAPRRGGQHGAAVRRRQGARPGWENWEAGDGLGCLGLTAGDASPNVLHGYGVNTCCNRCRLKGASQTRYRDTGAAGRDARDFSRTVWFSVERLHNL
ncbi:hypothetical protein HPB47_009491 [Ixodes persulcatus]|uniref:Uncharacterized protein n=1 Tax=Ixodes persulcatus TaxID=34615 RepID=A0AC60P1P8_IXOPE|nr:hypothetical protein HPB47_009491 [Ixodes persulcatus]